MSDRFIRFTVPVPDITFAATTTGGLSWGNVACRFHEFKMSRHLIILSILKQTYVVSLILYFMSQGSMSHLDFEKSLCRRVKFRSQGPYYDYPCLLSLPQPVRTAQSLCPLLSLQPMTEESDTGRQCAALTAGCWWGDIRWCCW